jgi:glucosamine kinase
VEILKRDVIIAIDGGGTYTRTVACNINGNIISSALRGGSHPQKNKNAKSNVCNSINEVIEKANININDIRILVGGFAGLNSDEDMKWAEQLINIEGLRCQKVLVNDAVIAQNGAFSGKSGIVCIAGTGSTVLGLNEDGRIIKNYDFQYSTKAAARYFSYEALFHIITKRSKNEKNTFIRSVFEYWNVKNIDELSKLIYDCLAHENPESIQKISQMAYLVTSYAEKGDSDMEFICKKVLNTLCLGANIVASRFSENIIPISLIGGIFNSAYIKQLMQSCISDNDWIKECFIVEPEASPIIGAILIAYDKLGIKMDKISLSRMIHCEKRLQLYK